MEKKRETMAKSFPLRVMVMDDDSAALKWYVALLMRDPRTTVQAEAETAGELVQQVAEAQEGPDAILIDVEYWPPKPSLSALITTLKSLTPGAAILCLSQYGDVEAVRAAITAEANAFLLKSEVRVAIASAITQASRGQFVITPGVESLLRGEFDELLGVAHRLPTWRPHPDLTPQLENAFWLRVMYGMRSPLAAQETGLKPGTITRYVQDGYSIVEGFWADERYLYDVDLNNISAEDRAFVWFTLPPRPQRTGYQVSGYQL